MLLWEYALWQDGWRKSEEDKWQQTRWLGALIVNYAGKISNKTVTPEELIPLSFDKKEVKVLTLDEKFAMADRIKNVKVRKLTAEEFTQKYG